MCVLILAVGIIGIKRAIIAGLTRHHNPTSLVQKKFMEHSLWSTGPIFLLQSTEQDIPECHSPVLIGTVCNDISFNSNYLNSFDMLQRVSVSICRFISNCRATSSYSIGHLSDEEINKGASSSEEHTKGSPNQRV